MPGHANRTIPLLGETALVDDQCAVRFAAEQAVGIATNLLDHRLVPPGRVADEALELLLAAVLNHGGHHREGRRCRLRQPLQATLRHDRVVVRAGAEQRAVAVNEAHERIRNAVDQR